ncbi:MAG: hypothetical protein KDA92_02605 [Planctomycetales bacterium]|nr:hypothetical protein [Planctomycetales bacterium]
MCRCDELPIAMSIEDRWDVEYRGSAPVTLIGTFTRDDYTFDGEHRRQAIDPRDAAMLTSQPLFRILGIRRG